MNARQQQFVREYLVDRNATQAAIRAGYAEGSAAVTGSRLLTNAKIAKAVAEGIAARAENTAVTAEWVVARLQAEALDCGEGASHSARVRALELLGKHQGMFVEKVELQSRVKLEIVEEIVDGNSNRSQDHPPPPRPG